MADYCIVLFAESSGIARGLVSRKIPGNLCRASTKPETDELQHRHFRAAVDAEIKKKQKSNQNSDKYIGSFFDWRSNMGSTQ